MPGRWLEAAAVCEGQKGNMANNPEKIGGVPAAQDQYLARERSALVR